jgi:hypothetical protein
MKNRTIENSKPPYLGRPPTSHVRSIILSNTPSQILSIKLYSSITAPNTTRIRTQTWFFFSRFFMYNFIWKIEKLGNWSISGRYKWADHPPAICNQLYIILHWIDRALLRTHSIGSFRLQCQIFHVFFLSKKKTKKQKKKKPDISLNNDRSELKSSSSGRKSKVHLLQKKGKKNAKRTLYQLS